MKQELISSNNNPAQVITSTGSDFYFVKLRLMADLSTSRPACYLEVSGEPVNKAKDSESFSETYEFGLPLNFVLAWRLFQALAVTTSLNLENVSNWFTFIREEDWLVSSLTVPAVEAVSNITTTATAQETYFQEMPPEAMEIFFLLRKQNFPLAFLPFTAEVLQNRLVWSEQLMLAGIMKPDGYEDLLLKSACRAVDPYVAWFISFAKTCGLDQDSVPMSMAKSLLASMLLNGQSAVYPDYVLFSVAYLMAMVRIHPDTSDQGPETIDHSDPKYPPYINFINEVDTVLRWIFSQDSSFVSLDTEYPNTASIRQQVLEAYYSVCHYTEAIPYDDFIPLLQPELPLEDSFNALLITFRMNHPQITHTDMRKIMDILQEMRRIDQIKDLGTLFICAAAINMATSPDQKESRIPVRGLGTDFALEFLMPRQADKKFGYFKAVYSVLAFVVSVWESEHDTKSSGGEE